MGERSDYYIEKVRYNAGRTKIAWVSVRQDSGSRIGAAHNMARKAMLSLLQEGNPFQTIFRNEEGKYRKGQKIGIIRVKGVDYIRTDLEPTAKDLLESLPEF